MSRTVWTMCLLGLFAGSSTAMSQEFRFESDWLYMSRNNGSDQNFVTGPDSFSADDADYGFQSGYRFTLGGSSEYYDLDLVFTQIDGWNDSTARTLGTVLILDDSGVAPFNALAFRNAIFDASTTAAVGNDETTESERINAGATLLYNTDSDLKTFEINFGTNRAANWWSFGLGYQHLRFNDTSNLLITGTFDAVDLGAPPGNDGLAHLSLTGAGLGLVSGGADGYDAAAVPVAGPDTLAMSFIGDAENELNGMQAIIGGRFYPGDSLVIESLTKLGLYHNQVRANYQETYIGSGQDDSIYQRALADESTVASFVGSTALRAIVPVTDYISFIAGYEVMVLTNVALGADQAGGLGTSLLGATTYHANADGHALIHGTTVGLEVVW